MSRIPTAKTADKRRLEPKERELEIVRAAVAFFAEFGFDGSTRELAVRLGITQPLLYRYFPSKEALLDRVYEEVYVNRWNKDWETQLRDRAVPLEDRLVRFYQGYAKVILNYEWVRLFMFAGLKGLDFNARYLTFLRSSAFDLIAREIRLEHGLPTDGPVLNEEAELIWGLHAAIFYLGVRQFIYGMPVPDDLDADLALRVRAFLRGMPAAVGNLIHREGAGKARRAG